MVKGLSKWAKSSTFSSREAGKSARMASTEASRNADTLSERAWRKNGADDHASAAQAHREAATAHAELAKVAEHQAERDIQEGMARASTNDAKKHDAIATRKRAEAVSPAMVAAKEKSDAAWGATNKIAPPSGTEAQHAEAAGLHRGAAAAYRALGGNGSVGESASSHDKQAKTHENAAKNAKLSDDRARDEHGRFAAK